MKHVEYWLADDGTRFEEAGICEVYERMQSKGLIEGLKLLDENCCEVTYKDGDYLDDFAGKFKYIKVSNKAALDWLLWLAEFTGTPLPAKLGTFFWDAEYGKWVCIEDLLDGLAVIRRKLTE